MTANSASDAERFLSRFAMTVVILALTAGPLAADNEEESRQGNLASRVLQTLSSDGSDDEEADAAAAEADDNSGDSDAEADAGSNDASPRLSPIFRSVSPTRVRAAPSSSSDDAADGEEDAGDEAETDAADEDLADAPPPQPLTADPDASDDDEAADTDGNERETEPADEGDDPTDRSGNDAPANDAQGGDGRGDDEGNEIEDEEEASARVTRVVTEQPERSASPRRRPTVADENSDRDVYRDYRIREGDTFSRIAKRLFDDEKKWVAIAQANPKIDPARLRVGQTIRVPDPDRYEAERERQLARVAAAVARTRGDRADEEDDDDARTVTVSSGDTLSHIARRVYGRATLWRHIFEANRDQLDEPNDLEVGMELTIPPQPE